MEHPTLAGLEAGRDAIVAAPRDLPAGTRLRIGTAIVEITPAQHRGCAKFAARFGPDTLRFVRTVEGRALRLRGVHARVVGAGVVRTGDEV